MSWLHWLTLMYVMEAATIMASYEYVYRPRPDKPWLEVIVGTLIWTAPPFLLDVWWNLPKHLFQIILLGSLLVVGGAMMSWIFLVHLNDNKPTMTQRGNEKRNQGDLLAWQDAMLKEVEHALDRQAFFVEQLEKESERLTALSQTLGNVQATINGHAQQVSLYRQIGEQVACDMRKGRKASYVLEKRSETQSEGVGEE